MKVGLRAKLGLIVLGSLSFSAVSHGQVQKPPIPTGFTATAGDTKVGLQWWAATGATSYHLKRSTTSGGPYTQIAAPTYAGYTDVGVKNGTTYFYVVSAVNAGGESGNSAQVSAKPAAAVTATPGPTGLSATAGDGQVGLRWSSITGATSYHVKRATVSGGPYVQVAAPWWNGYTDVGADNGTTYFYVVSAMTAKGESANSAQVSAKPTAPTGSTSTTTSGSTGSLPPSFFGLSISQINASHFPTVPFGGVRLWDTNTSWAQVEISPGTYSWSELDTWVRSVSSHGKDAMYTFGRVPTWGSMRPGEACPYLVEDPGCAAPPADVDSGDNMWKAFVTALVKHSLSAPELHIAYYEMWNEPDLKRNWTGTPAQLVTMAKDACAIIHALDPKAKLVGPGASTANQYGVHYLPDYYAAGGANAQDIVGLHAYLYDGSSFATSPAGITTSISQLKALMAKYNISSKPIWFTEGNWNGDGGGTLTDAQKAAYLAQEYMLMWSTGAVARYYWYAWDARVGNLWTPTTGLNQAGAAFDLLADWLIGSTHSANPCSVSSDGTWTCSLTLSSKYPGKIIWNPSISKTLTVDSAFATYETLTSSTVRSIVSHQVAIGPLPVLVIGTQTVQ
jgi:fibronectin type 3 domain-containing protein